MTIPLGDATVGYVTESQYIDTIHGMRCRGAYFYTSDFYEGRAGYKTMTYAEFKEKYPIESARYRWLRYVERKYN